MVPKKRQPPNRPRTKIPGKKRAGATSPRSASFADLNAYYKSEKWAVKRELYFLKKGKYCKACGSLKDVQVHHMSYEHFKAEPMSDLVSLCAKCHKEVTALCRANGHKDDRHTTLLYIRRKRTK